MIRKPNDGRTPERWAPNHIWTRFSEEFRVLLDHGYYEGTKFAEFYNVVEDGKSNIYVADPHEGDLRRFDSSRFNEMKFLVGLTGMGKTTLIRNYYGITERDVEIRDDEYVAYISYFYADLSLDAPHESVTAEVERYFSALVEKLLRRHATIRDDPAFWFGFFHFIHDNKPTLLSSYRFTPRQLSLSTISNEEPTEDEINEKLERLYLEKRLEYYSSLVKYILKRVGRPYKITFVFDDIEAKDSRFHSYIIDTARHVYSCFSASSDSNCTVKVLVSLRAYTFRSNVERTAEARRETIKKDVILKTATVPLKDIFEARFEAIANRRIRDKEVGEEGDYRDAMEVVRYVGRKLDDIGGDLIYNLQNYNLCDAMVLYAQVLTNLRWISQGETEVDGGFVLDERNYRITRYNLLCAIGMENASFYDGSSESVPNVIQSGDQETVLLCLYVIRYMLQNEYVGVYGKRYINGGELLDRLVSLFCNAGTPQPIQRRWRERLNDVIGFLYGRGLLLRSLYDIEVEKEGQIEREYEDDFKLYLSPRGTVLYALLGRSSVLMELYRDDIDTDLDNNDRVTSEMSAYEKYVYLIGLLRQLFTIEKRNMAQALFDLKNYVENVGNTFICEHILYGIAKNVNAYYGERDDDYASVVREVGALAGEMSDYAKVINESYGERLSLAGLGRIDRMFSDYNG